MSALKPIAPTLNDLSSKKAKKLLETYLQIEEEDAYKSGNLGFMARMLVQTTLPHRDPGEEHLWGRQNGKCAFTIQPGVEPGPDGKPKLVGLPYGTIPRLLMIWVATEVIRTQNRKLILGSNLSEFMSKLDLVPTGGRWGTVTRLREQMKRLFSARISFSYGEKSLSDDLEQYVIKPINIGETHLWWDPKNPAQNTFVESHLMLSEEFHESILEASVPLDMRAIKAFKQSPLELDIYTWLTYRCAKLRKPTPEIPWASLANQFGSDFSRLRDFKARFIKHLKNVLVIYPDAKVEEGETGLILKPSKTHITKRPPKLLTVE